MTALRSAPVAGNAIVSKSTEQAGLPGMAAMANFTHRPLESTLRDYHLVITNVNGSAHLFCALNS
jgi:hypothetical protein